MQEFNKKLMLENIEHLLKQTGMKIGELETAAGVSTGYISRISKEGGAKPGIDFIINVAAALGVSVDTLITIPLAEITPTEKYLISFLEKLKRDTAEDNLEWEKETAYYLNRMQCNEDGVIPHPLFQYEFLPDNGAVEGSEYIVFQSNAFGVNTEICGDCFHLEMKNGARFYLMEVINRDVDPCEGICSVEEAWMWTPGAGAQFICSSKSSPIFTDLVSDLYQMVREYSMHPKLKFDLRIVIDAYMKEDFKDDDDLPF